MFKFYSHYIILNKKTKIGVIGLGYVGLPLIIRLVEVGFKTIGFDIDEQKIKKLNNGESYIKHISTNNIASINFSMFVPFVADISTS